MSRAITVDLTGLPTPAFVETISVSALKQEIISDFLTRFPDANLLESDPAMKLLEVVAYREALLRARVNDAGQALLLAKAVGSDLDQLAALAGVLRLTGEDDDRFRLRYLLAIAAFSTCGPAGAYRYWAFSADLAVRDCSAVRERPGTVLVSILADTADGQPSDDLLVAVRANLSGDDKIPLTDIVNVRAAQIARYDVVARLTLYPGPDVATVQAAALAGVQAYAAQTARLGYDLERNGIVAGLTVTGVQRVELLSPVSDIPCDDTQVALLRDTAVTVVGRNI